MFVLLVMLLIAAITLSVMQFIAADQAAGIHELQGVQVFNVAEAGVHYAMGRLQQSGAGTYGGETITITSGSTTIGTATITVNCIDTGAAPPCSGTWAGYRRIISVGTLPNTNASRTIVAHVQGTSSVGNSYALCAFNTINVQQNAAISGDLGSGGTISLGTGSTVLADTNSPPQYTGLARASGTITCADGCPVQVAGGTFPSAPGIICPAVTTGPFAPGATPLTVGAGGFTMNSGTGYTWTDVTVANGSCWGGTPYTDLRIQAGAAGTTTVVQVRRLTMGFCSRLIILGAGNVDLRIGLASGTGLTVGLLDHFGVLSSDTAAVPAPAPASQFTVEVNSSSLCASGSCAATINTAAYAAGIYLVPNGEFQEQSATMQGAIVANTVTFGYTSVPSTFTYDTSAGTSSTYSNFNNLRSWKDQ
jgi:Tfp pilus assembly protein PilX